MKQFMAILGVLAGLWVAINVVIPVFGLSTGAIWNMDGMKPLADPVKAFAGGIGNSVGKFVSASPAPAPAAPAAPGVTILRTYPEKDPIDGCTYVVRELSDGNFPKTLVAGTCPVAHVAPAPAVPAPAPAAPAAPVAPTVAVVSGCPESRIDPGKATQVAIGCTVLGDVQVGDSAASVAKLYDDDPSTGLVVTFTRPGWVMAPWGASTTSRSATQVETEMRLGGCGSSCRSVDRKTW